MLRRGMINLVSMWESKNNFDSSDVLTGQVNFGTTKGTFLYFFFREYIQLSLIKAAAHKGAICLIILALTEVCTDDLDSQPLLVSVYMCVPVNMCVPSVQLCVCLYHICIHAAITTFIFLVFIFYLWKNYILKSSRKRECKKSNTVIKISDASVDKS